ncbi:MAG: hypothetical protein NZ518_05940, partial [Dehalococcoidia bacterium]|nr:hypothetical protein [Dehalococcoidia bacterium]
MRRLQIGLAALVLVSALLAAPVAATIPPDDSPDAMKAATRAYLAEVAPDLVAARVDLYRVVRDYALTRVVPPPAIADPALVLLQRRDGRWIAIGGPHTVFPDRQSRASAPDELFDTVTPFVGQLAEQMIAMETMPLLSHHSPLYSFSFPANAGVVTAGPAVSLVGPIVVGGAAPRNAYEIAIVVISPTVALPLDEWAYARVRATAAMRAREGVSWPEPDFFAASPVTDYYGATGVVLAHVDWPATDAIVRELYLAPVGGGVIVHLRIRLPAADDPHAPDALRALTILARTLSFPGSA